LNSPSPAFLLSCFPDHVLRGQECVAIHCTHSSIYTIDLPCVHLIQFMCRAVVQVR
jgi:hypothetical protein